MFSKATPRNGLRPGLAAMVAAAWLMFALISFHKIGLGLRSVPCMQGVRGSGIGEHRTELA
jgi:hypothetical protein